MMYKIEPDIKSDKAIKKILCPNYLKNPPSHIHHLYLGAVMTLCIFELLEILYSLQKTHYAYSVESIATRSHKRINKGSSIIILKMS
jgi:hypothetical protein